MLYTPANHAPLTKTTWDENRAGDSIRAIVADTHSVYDPGRLWPAHEWDGYRAAVPMKNLYVGAAGVVWALERLRRCGYESGLDSAAAARRALELFRAAPDYMADEVLPEQKRSSLLCGESGIALVAWQLDPSAELAEDLLALVLANIGNEANELMWGVPGDLARRARDAGRDRRSPLVAGRARE